MSKGECRRNSWPVSGDRLRANALLRRKQRGFTLIELVMVMLMVGVLAVFAAPRIFNTGDFYSRGFHDEMLGLLRYAQKTAIAQRHTVCVTFFSTTPPSVSLTMASTAGTTSCAVTTPLTGPKGAPTVTARSGVAFGATPTNFNFDGLGQPITAAGALMATQTIQISSAANVIVEAATGYVHE